MRTMRWLLLALIAAAQIAAAQGYPTKPVRLLVPYPAGGPVDAVARILVPHLSLGQNVIVENRSGAGGSIGAESVAKSAPDGYMMLIGNTGPMTINPVLRRDLGYDPRKDFAPVTWLTSSQMVLVVHPSLPVHSLKEFVALARSRPGELNYGTAGVGNLTHLGMELFQSMAKVKLNHVPYKGVAPAYVDLISGEIAVMFGNVTGPLAHIQAGRLRAIAVTSSQPSPVLPQVPRVADSYPGFDLVTWMGIFFPAGTPEAIRAQLQGEFQKALRIPDVRERLVALGNDVVARSGEDMAALIDRELKLYAKIVKSVGMKPQ
ncbi:MAG: tripartite tricarboxylate transporter substrate binding protein [Betaproteobacteria bacterium]|nr:tripartite tricarboxylate transporter substrate binding protein [Betaproteobacteria bacterium]MBI3055044.1 tripartite tricarboxylate transporter substrate binding protein [Betaproteobacteria bacterium]